MSSIELIINDLFDNNFIYKMQASEPFGRTSIQNFNKSDFIFFGGTNALTSNINKEKYIGFSLHNLFYFNHLLLLGVGWWQYQKKPNLYTKIFLKRMLHSSMLHSVRDSYTKKMLESIGIENVVNTSCPSTWGLDKNHCNQISQSKSDSVVFTITDYSKQPETDTMFINQLLNRYQEIFFWPQGVGDLEYFSLLEIPLRDKIKVLQPNLKSFDSLMENNKLDYIGTRLHAGIRALQYKNRALIIAIDNRALEIAHDIKLDISERGNLDQISFFVENNSSSLIKIPILEIDRWKNQFNLDIKEKK
jgi:polysaccharide pyruvyl transferase WcaK-like protein